MTVGAQTVPKLYNGDGATVQFLIPWEVRNTGWIEAGWFDAGGVWRAKINGADYTVAKIGASWFLTFNAAPPAGTNNVAIVRKTPGLQQVQFRDLRRFPAENTEAMGDLLAEAAQDIAAGLLTSFRLAPTDYGKLAVMDPLSGAVGKFWTIVSDTDNPGKFKVSFSPSVAAVEATAAIANEIFEVANISEAVVIVATGSNPGNIGIVAGSIAAVQANFSALGAITTNAANIPAITINAANIAAITTNAANILAIGLAAASIDDIIDVAADLNLGAGLSFILRAPQAAVDAIAAKDVTLAYTAAGVDEPVEGVPGEKFIFNPQTDLDVIANVVTRIAHGLRSRQPFTYRVGAGGAAPAGWVNDTQYFAEVVDADHFKFAATRYGAAIDVTNTGAGIAHEIFPIRSALHHQAYSEIDALRSEAGAFEAESAAAAMSQIYLGAFANNAAAWADGDAAPGAIYDNTTDGKKYVLGLTAPNADLLAPPKATTAQMQTGTDDGAYATAAGVKAAVETHVFAAHFPSKERNSKYFGILGAGATDTAKWQNIAGEISAGNLKMLHLGAGTTVIDAALASIVTPDGADDKDDKWSIIGAGSASRIVLPGGAGLGRLFQIGSASEVALSVTLQNFAIDYVAAAPSSEFTFDIDFANTVSLENIEMRGCANPLRVTKGGRMTLRNWKATPGSGAGAARANFHFKDISTFVLDDVLFSAVGAVEGSPGNVHADGTIFLFETVAGGSIDTIGFNRLHAQLHSGATDGRPHIIDIQMAAGVAGSATNIYIENSLGLDHASVSAIRYETKAGNSADTRLLKIKNNRIVNDLGKPIEIINAGSGIHGALDILENHTVVQDDNPCLDVIGDWESIQIGLNKFFDRNPGTAKAQALRLDCGNFNLFANDYGSDGGAASATGFAKAINLVRAAADNFSIAASNRAPKVPTWLTQPVYTAPPGRRHIEWPTRLRQHHVIDAYDDFDGDGISHKWIGLKGSNATAAYPAVSAGQVGGYLALVTGADAGGTMALNGSLLCAIESWRAVNGELIMAGRIRTNVLSNLAFFFGLTDQHIALEMPFTLSGTTYTSDASNAVGVLYDSAASSDTFRLVGVKNDVDAAHIDTGILTDTAHNHFKICLAVDGTARFFMNDAQIGGDLANAVDPNTLLTPVFCGFSRSNVSRTLIVDYIDLTMRRL